MFAPLHGAALLAANLAAAITAATFAGPAQLGGTSGHVVAGSPSARVGQSLLVADVGSLSRDEQLVFTALQGIVNRAAPRIYLEGMDATATRWLGVAVPLPTQTALPYDLLAQFRSSVRGLVVWDPRLPVDTQNIATTIAGLRDLLPVSPQLATQLSTVPYHFRVVDDLRRYQFSDRAHAYDWALTHLGPLSQFSHLAWLGGSNRDRHGLRDLIVARRGFAFEGDPGREHDVVTRILNAFPPGMPVLGYPFYDEPFYRTTGVAPNESFGVGEISQSGKFLIPTDLASNLTVHSWFKPAAQHPTWDDRPHQGDLLKTYVSFLISDGDNLGYNEQYLLTNHWDDPARGTIPMGVSVSPWLAAYAPRIYDYYVRTLAPTDVLVSGPSGAGYTYPSFNTDLDHYLQRSRRLLDFDGLRSVWILDNGYAWSPSPLITQRYAAALQPSAIFTDYGGWVVPNPPPVSFSSGVPVVHALWGTNVSSTVQQIRLASLASGSRPGFVLVALSTWSMSYAQAVEVMRQLGPSFEVVRPDRFVGLIRQAYGPLSGAG